MKNLKLCKALTFIRYFAESLFYPFISLFLSSIGLSVSQIGIIIAAIPITSILCAPIYSKLCTNPTKTKRALMIMSIVEAIFILVFVSFSSFVVSLILIILISIVSSSNYGMLDSLLTLSAQECKRQYSSVRIYGSISYMLGVLVSGSITAYISYQGLFYIACSLFVSVTILYIFIQPPIHQQEESEKPRLKELFINKSFIGYLIFYVLFVGSMQVGDDFFSLYMVSKGVEEHLYSYVMFGFIAVEIITMFILNKFGKKISIRLFFLSLILLLIRFIIQGMEGTPGWLLIASQMLRGIIWASALYLSSTFISEILGYNLATSGIILVMLGVQIFNSIFKFCGGYMIERIGFASFYLILLGMTGLAFLYFIFYYIQLKKSRKSLGKVL